MKTRENLKVLKAAMYGNTEAMTDLGYGMICDNLSRQASDVGMYWLKLAVESGCLQAHDS